MTTLYKRYDVNTIAEVNTLALSDNQENGSLVLGPYGETCSWILPYAIRNEPTTTGYWSYQDGYGGDQLRDGDEVTVLVPIEAEEETTGTGPHELDQGAPILDLGYYRASTRCLCGYEVIWGEHDGDAGLDEAWRVHLMRSNVSTARAT